VVAFADPVPPEVIRDLHLLSLPAAQLQFLLKGLPSLSAADVITVADLQSTAVDRFFLGFFFALWVNGNDPSFYVPPECP